MKCRCPACGRTTLLESHLLDFFTRCDRCGILLRPGLSASAPTGATADSSAGLTAKIVHVGRLRQGHANVNGQLADLLSRPAPALTELPWQPPATPPAAAPRPRRTLSTRRAMLRQHHNTLGFIGWCGSALIAILAIAGLSLKARSLRHPPAPTPDTLHAR